MIDNGWFSGGDFVEFWGRRYYVAFGWKQPLRVFRRYAWGFERGWCGSLWTLFLGWFVVSRRIRRDA